MNLSAATSAEVNSWVFQIGTCPEEGTPIHAESFWVSVVCEDGTRLDHAVRFPNRVKVEDRDHEFGEYFAHVDVSAKVEALAVRIQEALDAGIALNADLWREGRPVYGSDRYVTSGAEEDQIALEREEG